MATIKDWSIYSITQWVYFTKNYPPAEDFFKKLYGNLLGEHIFKKWLEYDGNWNTLYVNLDSTCQKKLADWVSENYQGIRSRRPADD